MAVIVQSPSHRRVNFFAANSFYGISATFESLDGGDLAGPDCGSESITERINVLYWDGSQSESKLNL